MPDDDAHAAQLANALGALDHIWNIVHTPTRDTPHRGAADHFAADFDNIRNIIKRARELPLVRWQDAVNRYTRHTHASS